MENFSEHILGVVEILTPKFIRDLKKYYPEAYTQLIVFRDQFDNTLSRTLFKTWDNMRRFSDRRLIKEISDGFIAGKYKMYWKGDTSHTDVNRIIEE